MKSKYEYYLNQGIHFERGDCIDLLKEIPDQDIPLILQDPPYGITQNPYDTKIDLKRLSKEWIRVLKPNGALILFAQQLFATDLINCLRDLYRYNMIWQKGERTTGFLNCNKMPLRNHEEILVFYKSLPVYNPQFTIGEPTHKRGTSTKNTNNNYGKFDIVPQKEMGNKKYPKSVLNFERPHPPIHPTQKPVDLMKWLINTYSNPGDIVFDGFVGSGTTPLACIETERRFIGAEIHPPYYNMAVERIKAALSLREINHSNNSIRK